MKRLSQAACALLVLTTPALAGDLAGVLRPTPVFAAPSELGAPEGMANQGDTYAVRAVQGEWVEVQYSERTAWVRALDVVVRDAELSRTIGDLHVRTGPGLERTILAILPRGTWVAERGGTGDWRQISFRGRTAWVAGEYLESEHEAGNGRGRAATGGAPGRAASTPARGSTPAEVARAWMAEDRSRPAATGAANEAPATTPSGRVPDRTAVFESTTRAGTRGQMKTGTIRVNGRDYTFRSGGYGRGNLPPGEYAVTPHLWRRSNTSMNVGGEGYSFALSDAYDPRVGARRSLLRIHPDGGVAGTEGCIGIVGDAATQRQFREDMREELRRNGGRFTLTVR